MRLPLISALLLTMAVAGAACAVGCAEAEAVEPTPSCCPVEPLFWDPTQGQFPSSAQAAGTGELLAALVAAAESPALPAATRDQAAEHATFVVAIWYQTYQLGISSPTSP